MNRVDTDLVSRESRVELQYGAVIRDTYTVDSLLGQGMFADVYLVRHRYMGMQAMKVFRRSVDEKQQIAGFNEAFLLSRITHPGIVRVFDANRLNPEENSSIYITMEYVSGGTLAGLLEKETLAVPKALDLAVQAAEAVAHAHRQSPPIVHRDIKPQNMLIEDITGVRHVRVADFGLATRVNRVTETVAAGGTIQYMSPESLVGYETPASDVYSLGLTIHQILCDCLPYQLSALPRDATTKQIIEKLDAWQREPFRPPSYFNSKISPDIDAVILRSLTHSAKNRYADAGELRDALAICKECIEDESSEASSALCDAHEVDDASASRARQALGIAFQVASQSGRRGEAREWLEEAFRLDPKLQGRFGTYLELWSKAKSPPAK